MKSTGNHQLDVKVSYQAATVTTKIHAVSGVSYHTILLPPILAEDAWRNVIVELSDDEHPQLKLSQHLSDRYEEGAVLIAQNTNLLSDVQSATSSYKHLRETVHLEPNGFHQSGRRFHLDENNHNKKWLGQS